MRRSLARIVAPVSDPVSLAEMKDHLRTDDHSDDVRIASMISAVTQNLDGDTGWLGRSIMPQTWELKIDFFSPRIWLPYPPLRSVTSVRYFDENGVDLLLDASVYRVVLNGDQPSFIEESEDRDYPITDDQPQAVTVRYVAGYDVVPEPIRAAIKFGVEMMFDCPDGRAGETLDRAFHALLAPFRVRNVI